MTELLWVVLGIVIGGGLVFEVTTTIVYNIINRRTWNYIANEQEDA